MRLEIEHPEFVMTASLPRPSPENSEGKSKSLRRYHLGHRRIVFILVFVPALVYFLPGASLQISYLTRATRTIASRPCGRTSYSLGATAHSFAGANYREVTRIAIGPFQRGGLLGKTLKFSVFRASGRELAIG